MRITNKFNLPETIVKAVKHDTHKMAPGADLSVSALIDAPQIRVLKKRVRDLEQDASEMLWALLGTAMHNVLERAYNTNFMSKAFTLVIERLMDRAEGAPDEERGPIEAAAKWLNTQKAILFPQDEQVKYLMEQTMIIEIDGMHISGTFDIYDQENDLLEDYKMCSVWQYIYPESRNKWTEQLNCYAHMLRETKGIYPKGIRVTRFFRDWSRQQASINPDYPKTSIMTFDVPLWDSSKAAQYMSQRVALHRAAEKSYPIPECTGSERWATAAVYKVKLPGMKKAIRNFDNEADARKWIADYHHLYDKKGELIVDVLPGENKRCMEFCQVRKVCEQRAKLLNL